LSNLLPGSDVLLVKQHNLIIHLHFHSRTTGITKSIESIFPVLNKYTDARIFGYGIGLPRINLPSLLKLLFSKENVVIHAHRNNEIIFALLIRLLGGRFNLVFTRHAETRPSGLTGYLMKQADVLISLTPSMSKILKNKSTIVRHGVDTEKFCIGERKRIKGITQENLISVIGRVRPSKGQLVVLSAITDLLRIHQDWGLILVGKIDENNYARDIISKAEKNGIASQVHFLPETSRIVDIYHASKVVVIASPSEGFSLVCLEALACGIVTIATESVGVHYPVNAYQQVKPIINVVLVNDRYLK